MCDLSKRDKNVNKDTHLKNTTRDRRGGDEVKG